MKMKKMPIAAVLAFSLLLPSLAGALTAEELQKEIAGSAKLTVIDSRSQADYVAGHIPGAINIPSGIMKLKRLPALGNVVVYGDGIRTDLTLEALEALNDKDGIEARMLEGGFGAWEASKQQTTHTRGMSKKQWRYLTFNELKKAAENNPDIVLVDLRTGEDSDSEATLTDLYNEFPLQEIVSLQKRKGKWDIKPCLDAGDSDKLFVLIDDGKGQSNKVARRMTASGIKRVALLAGGEISLVRKGRSEIKREVTRKDLQ